MLVTFLAFFILKSQALPSVSRTSDRDWVISVGGRKLVLPSGGGGNGALAQVDLTRKRIVVPGNELLGLDFSGRIVWRYPLETDFDPRPFLYCSGVVLFGAGWTRERHVQLDAEMLKFAKQDHATIALDATRGHVLWKGSTVGVGTPIAALSSKEFLSLNIANREDVYLNGASEKYKIERVSIANGRVLQSWKLTPSPEALYYIVGYPQ